MTDTKLAFTPAYTLAQLVRKKEVSPTELVELYLERISILNPKLNSYLTVAEDQAREAAMAAEKALDTESELPSLHGVPVAIKDTEYTKGIRTTLGSLVYKDFVPDEDSIVVERLKAAGAIVIGKANAPELAFDGRTYNRLGDDARNPWNRERTTGGSSGGSAAAVATAQVPMATGSDFGGSIRIPASFCGVYGIKPTHGRVPLYPSLTDMIFFFDTGPITRTVRDAALMLNVIAGHDSRDPMSLRERPPNYLSAVDGKFPRLKIAWSSDLGFAPIEPEVRTIFESAVHVFETLGCIVEEAELKLEDDLEESYMPIFHGDEWAFRGHLLEEHADELTQVVRQSLEESRNATAAEYSNALRRVYRLQSKMEDFMEDYDLLLIPTNALTAFPHQVETVEIAGKTVDTVWGVFPFSPLCNMTGQPAASVPCGFASDGLPVGLQIISRLGDETRVLQASAAFESAHPWADDIPPVAQF